MKQIILLGDSVRMQYQKAVGEKLADIAEVSGPEENGRWSGYTLNSLRFWLPNLPAPDLVQWNAGLWDMGDDYQEGRHFYPLDLYEETCHRICRILRKVTGKPDLPIVIATTTPTMHGDHGDILLYNDVLPTIGGASRSLRVGHLFIRQEWNAPLFFMGGQETDGSNKYHTDINYWINQFKLNPSWNNDKSDPASRILFDGTNGGKGFLAYKYRFQKYSDSYNVVWDFASLKRDYLSGTRDAADHPHALKFGERTVEGDNAETVYVYFNNTQVYGAHDSSEGTTYINSMYSYDEKYDVYYRYMITDLNNPENNYIPFTEQRIPTPVDAGPLTGGSSTAAGVALKGDVVITDEEDGAITFANIIVQHIGMRWMGDAAPYPELTGSGNADFFIGGKHYAGVWNRDDLDDRTVFYGEDGQEIALNPGRTIIVQLPSFSASFNADLTRNDKCVLKYE